MTERPPIVLASIPTLPVLPRLPSALDVFGGPPLAFVPGETSERLAAQLEQINEAFRRSSEAFVAAAARDLKIHVDSLTAAFSPRAPRPSLPAPLSRKGAKARARSKAARRARRKAR